MRKAPRRPVLMCLAALAAAPLLTGCASNYRAAVKPTAGALFTQVKAPLTTNFNGNPVGPGVKKFSRRNTYYFFSWPVASAPLDFAWDEVAIGRIAKEGGIHEVSYADYEFLNVLGIFATFTINVYGN